MKKALKRGTRRRKPVGIDLFCGVGGMALGFAQAGFRIAAAVDAKQVNVDVHEKNFPDSVAICGDVRRLTGTGIRTAANIGIREIDVVFGGPPCQGFSVGGKQCVDDPRNDLLLEFARLVVELSPRYFVMENVAGILGARYAPLLTEFKRVLQSGAYSIVEPLRHLDAADFGVPQRRKRVFVLGCREGECLPAYPTATRDRVTVGEALADLKVVNRAALVDGDSYDGALGTPSSYSRELRRPRGRSKLKPLTGFARTEHSDEVVERFKRVKPGEVDSVSRFVRLDPNSVAPTLRAGTGPENGSFMAPRPIHPDFPRCITVREAARLHSFPDWFAFHTTKWHGFMQIGNSVPPQLAKAVASEVMRSLTRRLCGASAVTGDDFTPHGERPFAQHGSRAEGAIDRPRTGSTVSRRQSRSTGFP